MSFFRHQDALVESDTVGEGTRVWAFAHIMAGAEIGSDCNVGDHAFIEEGVSIGDRVTIKNAVFICKGVEIEADAFIGPGVMFTNDLHPRSPRMPESTTRYEREDNWLVKTRIRRGASIGASSTILCGTTVGEYAMVGTGSVVTQNVAPYALVMGVPARNAGFVCLCGQKLGFKNGAAVCECGEQYELLNEGEQELCRRMET